MANTKVREQHKRRPFGVAQQRLDVGTEIPGYHLRWINDEPGRLQRAQQSGYLFVEVSEVNRVSDDEVKVRELVGLQRDEKTPMYAYLMKIPNEYYLEDRAAIDAQLDAVDEAIRGGRLNQQSNDGRYVPKGGISYKT